MTSSNEINLSSSPHSFLKLNTSHTMLFVIIALLPLCVKGVFLYGLSALLVILTSVLSCVASEALFQLATKQKIRVKDCSAIVTGILLALVCPPTVPLWQVALGGIFAIIVAKEFFGGIGANVFNPALAGRAFMFVSFPTTMGATWLTPKNATVINFVEATSAATSSATSAATSAATGAAATSAATGAATGAAATSAATSAATGAAAATSAATSAATGAAAATSAATSAATGAVATSAATSAATGAVATAATTVTESVDAISSSTILSRLSEADFTAQNYWDFFFGNRAGCIGESSILLILIAFVFLSVTRIIDWKTPLAMVGTVAIATLLAGGNVLMSVMAGGLLFGAVFMITDYATTPVTMWGRLIFAVGCGLITFLIRQFGGYPEGVMFSILIMNAVAPFLNRIVPRKYGYGKPQKVGR